jgi:mannosyltransferase OCH1-like enzyme
MIVYVIGLICLLLILLLLNKTTEGFMAQDKPFIWLYWENKKGVHEPPNYIKMCHESANLHCGEDFNVVILNENSVKTYLHDLRDDINKLEIPQKADYIRLKLLEKYGGIWLDSDIIVMRSLLPIMSKMKHNIDFVGFGCHSRNCKRSGKPKPANWVMASKPNTKFMNMCIEECNTVLDKPDKIKYFDLGRNLLWKKIKEIKKLDPSWDYYHYDSKCLDRDSNYNKIRNKRLISEEPIDKRCINESLFIPIYNTAPGFPDWFKNKSRKEILDDNMLISKIFRKCLFKNN